MAKQNQHAIHWLRVQLDGILEDAEARFRAIGSGSELSGEDAWSAAFLANLRDARTGVDGIEEQLEACEKARTALNDIAAEHIGGEQRLQEQLEALREALFPFARGADAFDRAEGTYGDGPVFERMANGALWTFTVADARRAYAAWAASSPASKRGCPRCGSPDFKWRDGIVCSECAPVDSPAGSLIEEVKRPGSSVSGESYAEALEHAPAKEPNA